MDVSSGGFDREVGVDVDVNIWRESDGDFAADSGTHSSGRLMVDLEVVSELVGDGLCLELRLLPGDISQQEGLHVRFPCVVVLELQDLRVAPETRTLELFASHYLRLGDVLPGVLVTLLQPLEVVAR